MPVIVYSKEYEETYRKRLLGMFGNRSMIDHASSIVVDEYRLSLLDAKEKAFILIAKEIMKLSNRMMAYVIALRN